MNLEYCWPPSALISPVLDLFMKRIFYTIIVVIAAALAIGIFIFQTAPSQVYTRSTEREPAIAWGMDSPCFGLTEQECYLKLHECVKNDSVHAFLSKNDGQSGLFWTAVQFFKDFKALSVLDPVIRTNFPDATIYTYIKRDNYSRELYRFPFIKLSGLNCYLDEENMRLVFAPVATEKDALAYLLLVNRAVKYRNPVYILDQSGYDDPEVKVYRGKRCQSLVDFLGNEQPVTQISSTVDGYVIKLISFVTIGKAQLMSSTIKIGVDGRISHLSDETLVNCGQGSIY